MAVIVITGASGFIGRQFQRHSAENGHLVRALTRADLKSDCVPLYAGADAVVHLAGRAHVIDEDQIDPAAAFRQGNLELVKKVFGDCISAGVKRFVFMSSAGVLGASSPPGGFHDDSPTAPHDDYTRSKSAAEDWLLGHPDRHVTRVIIRPPLVYGPNARGNFARIERAAAGLIPPPVGALRAPRSMIGLRNLCDFALLAALGGHVMTGKFLVCDEQTLSVRELTLELRKLFGRPPWIPSVPAGFVAATLRLLGRRTDAGRLTQPFEIRPSRARDLLGWRPPFTCIEELAWTASSRRSGSA